MTTSMECSASKCLRSVPSSRQHACVRSSSCTKLVRPEGMAVLQAVAGPALRIRAPTLRSVRPKVPVLLHSTHLAREGRP